MMSVKIVFSISMVLVEFSFIWLWVKVWVYMNIVGRLVEYSGLLVVIVMIRLKFLMVM